MVGGDFGLTSSRILVCDQDGVARFGVENRVHGRRCLTRRRRCSFRDCGAAHLCNLRCKCSLQVHTSFWLCVVQLDGVVQRRTFRLEELHAPSLPPPAACLLLLTSFLDTHSHLLYNRNIFARRLTQYHPRPPHRSTSPSLPSHSQARLDTTSWHHTFHLNNCARPPTRNTIHDILHHSLAQDVRC